MKVKVIRLAAAALLLGCSWKTSLLAGWWIGVIPETKQTSPNAMEYGFAGTPSRNGNKHPCLAMTVGYPFYEYLSAPKTELEHIKVIGFLNIQFLNLLN